MKKLFKISAMFIGAIAMATGSSSCKKDKNECCTLSGTYTYEGVKTTYSAKACEDGSTTYTYTYDGKTTTGTDSWKDDYSSWSELKEEAIAEGAKCS